jgi:hypothetical protein
MKRPASELKKILADRGISAVGLAEKRELADKIAETCATVTYYASQ